MSEPAIAQPIARQTPLAACLHLLVVYLVWGSTYLAVKICLDGPESASPVQLQAARLGCATLLLAAYAWISLGPPRGLSPAILLTSAASGVLLWVLGNGLATLAARDSTSSFIVMCMGLIPLWTVAIECLIQRHWPTRRVLTGLLTGFAGLAIMVWPGLQPSPGAAIIRPDREWYVLAILLAGGACWALGTTVQRRQTSSLPVAWIATLQMGGATVVLTLLAALEQAPAPGMPALPQLLAFGFLVVFGSIVAMISFQKVVRHFSPAVASTFAYVNPLVGMLLGALLLGEHIHGVSLAGFSLILMGLWMVLRKPASARR